MVQFNIWHHFMLFSLFILLLLTLDISSPCRCFFSAEIKEKRDITELKSKNKMINICVCVWVGFREVSRRTFEKKIDRGGCSSARLTRKGSLLTERMRGEEGKEWASNPRSPPPPPPSHAHPNPTVALYAWLLLLSLAFLPILSQSLGEDRGRQRGLS